MRIAKTLLTGTALLSLLSVSAAFASQNCETIRLNKGSGADYQKCLANNRKDSIKQQVDTYKEILDRQSQSIKQHYESRRNEEDYVWKDTDLRFEYQIELKKLRIKELEKTKEVAEEAEKQRGQLEAMKKVRDLLQKSHDQKKKRMDLREEAENHELDAALTDYELSLWQQNSSTDAFTDGSYDSNTATYSGDGGGSSDSWELPSRVDLHLFGN